jgi:hypothetical protein
MKAQQRQANEQWFQVVLQGCYFVWIDTGHHYRIEERDGTRVFVPQSKEAYADMKRIVSSPWANVHIVPV